MNSQINNRKEITQNILHLAIELGEVAFKSGICKVSSPAAATAMMLKGYELGFGLMGSFEMVQVIQGNVGLSPKGSIAIMRAHPELIEDISVRQLFDDSGNYIGCECTIKRRGFSSHTERFTMEDARSAGLAKADSNWAKYPQNMCKWRAVGFCADVVCPDLTGGLTRFLIEPELTDQTDFIEGINEPTPALPEEVITVQPALEAPKEVLTIETLLKSYSPEAVVAACEGKPLPKNIEELQALAEKLNGGAA